MKNGPRNQPQSRRIRRLLPRKRIAPRSEHNVHLHLRQFRTMMQLKAWKMENLSPFLSATSYRGNPPATALHPNTPSHSPVWVCATATLSSAVRGAFPALYLRSLRPPTTFNSLFPSFAGRCLYSLLPLPLTRLLHCVQRTEQQRYTV